MKLDGVSGPVMQAYGGLIGGSALWDNGCSFCGEERRVWCYRWFLQRGTDGGGEVAAKMGGEELLSATWMCFTCVEARGMGESGSLTVRYHRFTVEIMRNRGVVSFRLGFVGLAPGEDGRSQW